LEELHKLHDQWLLSSDRSRDEPPVITINADLSQNELFASLDQNSNAIFGNAL